MKPDPSRGDEKAPKINYSIFQKEGGDNINIKINFDDPTSVSMGDSFDKLDIRINKKAFNKAFLVLNEDGAPIPLPAGKLVKKTIPIPL